LMDAILSACASVNHKLPSGPAVMPPGRLLSVGTGKRLTVLSTSRSSSLSKTGRNLCRLRHSPTLRFLLGLHLFKNVVNCIDLENVMASSLFGRLGRLPWQRH